MSDILQKAKIEVITFASGLVSSFASSTGYFLGNADEEFGPYFTMVVVVIWLVFFFVLMFLEERKSNDPREEEEKPVGYKRVGEDNKKEKERSWATLLLIPWSLTIISWSIGVVLHASIPSYIVIEGIVLYDRPDQLMLHNRPVPDATIELKYANRTEIERTDNSGYYKFVIDIDPQKDIISVKASKDFHRSIRKKFDIHRKSNFSVPNLTLAKP